MKSSKLLMLFVAICLLSGGADAGWKDKLKKASQTIGVVRVVSEVTSSDKDEGPAAKTEVAVPETPVIVGVKDFFFPKADEFAGMTDEDIDAYLVVIEEYRVQLHANPGTDYDYNRADMESKQVARIVGSEKSSRHWDRERELRAEQDAERLAVAEAQKLQAESDAEDKLVSDKVRWQEVLSSQSRSYESVVQNCYNNKTKFVDVMLNAMGGAEAGVRDNLVDESKVSCDCIYANLAESNYIQGKKSGKVNTDLYKIDNFMYEIGILGMSGRKMTGGDKDWLVSSLNYGDPIYAAYAGVQMNCP